MPHWPVTTRLALLKHDRKESVLHLRVGSTHTCALAGLPKYKHFPMRVTFRRLALLLTNCIAIRFVDLHSRPACRFRKFPAIAPRPSLVGHSDSMPSLVVQI